MFLFAAFLAGAGGLGMRTGFLLVAFASTLVGFGYTGMMISGFELAARYEYGTVISETASAGALNTAVGVIGIILVVCLGNANVSHLPGSAFILAGSMALGTVAAWMTPDASVVAVAVASSDAAGVGASGSPPAHDTLNETKPMLGGDALSSV